MKRRSQLRRMSRHLYNFDAEASIVRTRLLEAHLASRNCARPRPLSFPDLHRGSIATWRSPRASSKQSQSDALPQKDARDGEKLPGLKNRRKRTWKGCPFEHAGKVGLCRGLAAALFDRPPPMDQLALIGSRRMNTLCRLMLGVSGEDSQESYSESLIFACFRAHRAQLLQ